MASEDPPLNLLDRAKAAKESAQSSVVSLAGDLKEQLTAKAGELKDAGLAQLIATTEDFNASLPILREAGYTLSGVDIGIGLPPKLTAEFVVSAEVSPEVLEQLLTDHADKKLTVLLVKSLHQAWQLHNKIDIAGLRAKSLSIEVGLIPEICVKYA
jgi:hypothetical protein